jgi:hypothetical protein
MALEGGQAPALNSPQSAVPVADLQETLRGLDARLKKTQDEVEELKKSDRSWLKKAGLVLGFLGGLIATPKLIKDNVLDIIARANTTVAWGRPLNIRYDQHDQVLRLDFPILANNEGTKLDVVDAVSATLRAAEKPDVNIPVSDSDIEINEDGHSVHQPFSLEAEKPRSLVFAFSLAPPFSAQALGFEGTRVLEVVLRTRDSKRISYQYCFNLDKAQADEVLAAKEMHVRFSSCD